MPACAKMPYCPPEALAAKFFTLMPPVSVSSITPLAPPTMLGEPADPPVKLSAVMAPLVVRP